MRLLLSPSTHLACLLLLAALPAHAGRYPVSGIQGFDYPDGTTNLNDGTEIASDTTVNGVPTAAVVRLDEGASALRLTHNDTSYTLAAFKLPDLDQGKTMESWEASLRVRMDKRRNRTPADGWSLSVGQIPAGLGGGEDGFEMNGGLVIAFDTYNNGNDVPSIEIFANGTSLANYPQNFNFSNTFRDLRAQWGPDGLTVTYDGQVICSGLPTPGYTPAIGDSFAFSARTGGAMQGTYLDDLLVVTTTSVPDETGGPVISEFAASNKKGLTDENGDLSDWIEIYNGSAAPVDLAGWSLTNNPANPRGWVFPSLTIPAYGYLVVYASGKNRDDPAYPLHTNFKISKQPGYLALFRPDASAASELEYAAQVDDITYGLVPGGTQEPEYAYWENPSPGKANQGKHAAGPPVGAVKFLKDGVESQGGLFASSGMVELTTEDGSGVEIRYTLDKTPPEVNSPVYSLPIPLSGLTVIRARAFAPGRLPGPPTSVAFQKIDATLTNYHGSGQPFSSTLPIIVLNSLGVPVDSYTDMSNRPYRTTYAVVIDPDSNPDGPNANRAVITSPPDFSGRSGVHVRGQTSAGFPQRSYKWELWDEENEDKNSPLLGLPSESDWVLHAPYTDKTLMRNYFTYDLARKFGGNAAGMGVRFVEVFFNQNGGSVGEGDYRGIYVLVEKIKRDSNRVDIEKLTPEMSDPELISGGYIFAKDKVNPGDITFSTNLNSFTLDTPKNPTVAQRTWLQNHLKTFETALTGPNFADPENGYAKYINPLSFIDNQWFVEITKQIDGYRISTYFYKDRNGKINSLPVWDYNLSLFNANYLGGDSHSGWYYPQLNSSEYYYWPRLHQDPNYEVLHWDRYWELRNGLFRTEALMDYIDGLAAKLTDNASLPVVNNMPARPPLQESPAMRHYRKWQVLGQYLWPNPNNYDKRTRFWNGPTQNPMYYQSATGEVDAMKSFLKERLAWIDDQNRSGNTIYRPPLITHRTDPVSGQELLEISRYAGSAPSGTSYASAGTLYYTLDGSDPRAMGGSPAGSPYGEPISVAGAVTVKARLLQNGYWSPLASADMIVNAVPAGPDNLVISELCYKPLAPAPNSPEYLAGFTSGKNFEYLELLNVSQENVDLSQCEIVEGVRFSFTTVPIEKLLLAPGQRALIVGSLGGFAARYGEALSDRVLGEYSGNLSNEGETVVLLAANGGVIASLSYGVESPWPEGASNSGLSLVLVNARSGTGYEAADFRDSLEPGGTPGESAGFPALVTLGNLHAVYTGTPQPVTAEPDPAWLPVSLTYDGLEAAPAEPGEYAVVAEVRHFDYTGAAADTLVITWPGYLQWQQEMFTAEQLTAGLAAPQADPDADGLPNLIEYALGTNPLLYNAGPQARIQLDSQGHPRLTLTFTRPAGLRDVSYTIEAASNLSGAWSTVASVDVEAIENTEMEQVTAWDFADPAETPRRFMRLRVELLGASE